MTPVRSLGSFGTPREAIDLDFVWCGEATIRVNPDATDMDFLDFMATARGVQVELADGEENDPDKVAQALQQASGALDLMYRFIRRQIHPDDWDEFLRIARANRQQVADLMVLARSLTEAISRFPTGRPSGSSDGGTTTSTSSSVGSSSRAERRKASKGKRKAAKRQLQLTGMAQERERESDLTPQAPVSAAGLRRREVATRTLQQLHGRPDLKLLVKRQYEAAESEAARTA